MERGQVGVEWKSGKTAQLGKRGCFVQMVVKGTWQHPKQWCCQVPLTTICTKQERVPNRDGFPLLHQVPRWLSHRYAISFYYVVCIERTKIQVYRSEAIEKSSRMEPTLQSFPLQAKCPRGEGMIV